MKINRKTVCAPIATLTLIGSLIGGANAAVISVNFASTGGHSLASGDSAGVEAATNWNNIISGVNTGANATTSNLNNNSGVATSTDITYFQNFWSVDGGTSNDGKLNSGYTDSGYGNTPIPYNGTLTIADIGTAFTSPGYDLILYLGGTDGQTENTAIEIGASVGLDTQWIRHIRPTEGSVFAYDSTTFGTEALAQASSANSNYIRFSGLNASDLSIDILKDPSTEADWSRASIRGIQLVAVPEPSSVLLLGIGVLGFAALRRRSK